MKKIIIADDERILRLLVVEILADGDYCITEAEDGASALEFVKKDQPDLLILDVMMPAMNGYEVCQAIKSDKRLAHIKVLLLTAKAQVDDQKTGQDVQADYYLVKPFSPAKLKALVEKILGC